MSARDQQLIENSGKRRESWPAKAKRHGLGGEQIPRRKCKYPARGFRGMSATTG